MTALAERDALSLASGFATADEARWRGLVAQVLERSGAARDLARASADGLEVAPLYTGSDWPAGREGMPGSTPFARGSSAAGTVVGGWDIRQCHAVVDPVQANVQVLEDLEGGVTSIQLRCRGNDAELARALAGVRLDLAPVGLEAGAAFATAAEQYLALVRDAGLDRAAVRADLNADPLGAAVAGEALDPASGLAAAVRLARTTAEAWPGIVALTADGRPYHAGGASAAQEIAFAIATGIAYLRATVEGGLPPCDAARQIGFALAADADFFLSLVKPRALRRLWGRVIEVAGAGSAMSGLRLRAETAPRMFSRVDPQVNMLRATVAACAAALGGATGITVLPFDHALGPAAPLARRVARNTQLILLEECGLGRVIDPAGGSWYVESLTEALAERAWALVQAIERRGGMAVALEEGWPQDLVATSRAEREAAVATRREPITGVSEFADLAEPSPPWRPDTPHPATGPVRPIPAYWLGESFERVRERGDAVLARTGQRPRVFLCTLGRPAEFAPRAGFARNLFAAGGFAAAGGVPLASLEDLGHAFLASGARQAAICSSDAAYATGAEGAARTLKGSRCRRVYLVGRPDQAQRADWSAAGVDEFVHAGSDVLATLERAHRVEAGETA